MCFFSPPKPPPVIQAPTRTSADIQNSAEALRMRMNPSGLGIASTIFTSGFGDPRTPNSKGVVLGSS